MMTLKVCPDCDGSGWADKVWRGFYGLGDCPCRACRGRGWRELKDGEVEGRIPACAMWTE